MERPDKYDMTTKSDMEFRGILAGITGRSVRLAASREFLLISGMYHIMEGFADDIVEEVVIDTLSYKMPLHDISVDSYGDQVNIEGDGNTVQYERTVYTGSSVWQAIRYRSAS